MNLYNVRNELNEGNSITNIYLRVTYYSRVSTDHIEQLNSLKNQKDYFEEMIKNNPNWVYVKGYVDGGISGTTDKRNNFMRMIDDAKKGMFDLILTKEISRFSRNTLDSIKYTRLLLSFGVAVLFINDNINTAFSDSELRLTIMASLAQDEVRRLSERVKFGMARSIKNGVILGNNMLYGYKKDRLTGNLIIVKEESEVVKNLFELYGIKGYSLNKIVKIFNQKNIKSVMGKRWSATTLSRMIKNPKYKGYYCGKKSQVIDYMTKKIEYYSQEKWVIYEDNIKIPPIVSKSLWERANNRLNNKIKESHHSSYALSGKIYCAKDNCVFHRRRISKNNEDIIWICSNYILNGKKYCNAPKVKEKDIYSKVMDILNSLSFDRRKVLKLLLKYYGNNNLIGDIEDKLYCKSIDDLLIKNLVKKILIGSKSSQIKILLKN